MVMVQCVGFVVLKWASEVHSLILIVAIATPCSLECVMGGKEDLGFEGCQAGRAGKRVV